MGVGQGGAGRDRVVTSDWDVLGSGVRENDALFSSDCLYDQWDDRCARVNRPHGTPGAHAPCAAESALGTQPTARRGRGE